MQLVPILLHVQVLPVCIGERIQVSTEKRSASAALLSSPPHNAIAHALFLVVELGKSGINVLMQYIDIVRAGEAAGNAGKIGRVVRCQA